MAILNSRNLPFLNVPSSPFQKLKNWNLDTIVTEYLEHVAKFKSTWNLAPVL